MGLDMETELMLLPGSIQDANTVKYLVLTTLRDDNVITKEQFEMYNTEYQVILLKRSWVKRWWDKFFSDKKDAYFYHITKMRTTEV